MWKEADDNRVSSAKTHEITGNILSTFSSGKKHFDKYKSNDIRAWKN